MLFFRILELAGMPALVASPGRGQIAFPEVFKISAAIFLQTSINLLTFFVLGRAAYADFYEARKRFIPVVRGTIGTFSDSWRKWPP